MKIKNSFLYFYLILFLFSCGQGKESNEKESIKGWIPSYKIIGDSTFLDAKNKDALISTPEAAAIVAKAAVTSIYSEKCAEKEQPYQIRKEEECWFVSGSLPDEYAGGTFWLSINMKNGKIEGFYHEK